MSYATYEGDKRGNAVELFGEENKSTFECKNYPSTGTR